MNTIREPQQRTLITRNRVLVWFSCGATSACAAKLSVWMYPKAEIIYCDTLANEHPDNARFLEDVSRWIGKPIRLIKSNEYTDIYDVFNKTGWLIGPSGARCTAELKRTVREKYQEPGDLHIFGFSAEETERIEKFEINNPELRLQWILRDFGLTKADCLSMLEREGIKLPVMYELGFKNNNCIGCVKGGKGYWNKIRRVFPAQFERMCHQERKMGARIFKDVWLDELPPNAGRYLTEPDIECGPVCNVKEFSK